MNKTAKIMSLAAMFTAVLAFSACSTAPTHGWAFTDVTFNQANRSAGPVLGNASSLSKRGESCSFSAYILNYIYYGGGKGVADAMRDGGITKIGVIDYQGFEILGGLYYKSCVIVYGE